MVDAVLLAVLLTVLEEVKNCPPGGPEEVSDWKGTMELEDAVVDEAVTEVDDVKN